ncbi:peptidase [Pseudomonas oryzihabitans]|uniref:ClpXP protease specificity-enhancing factor n=1 Tax=Pseudomonas rhizoryzae TaxID=2571129 RepID=UPI000737297B|nr:ClpXP protease specificity-enhancing factor [Pseudomonas rhizoryzae]APQ11475.1 ClpXP protease specificity-enhancing factor [Pseudomonas psychrotolerans]KTS77318.1 peptidase [Pseudomonas psychrotolerans]KTT03571.1 peptidase [Pseudomonas psychrotolerans]KTT14363.1 peptidase [Pseudomonas psychrotolerans]KTT23390.1 peptidase [Pseudomonas psychrotolerans]
MNSSRPYLVRALYEWIVDNDCTPHLLVNADYAEVRVPPGYANDGQIVLNASPSAVRDLHMDNEAVSFNGRFGGVAYNLYIPVGAILAIYARENGQGMVFDSEPSPPDGQGPDTGGSKPEAAKPAPARPSLKVVK